MQEIFEQITGYLKGIWIKRRYIIISTWLICPIGWLFVAQLDDQYQSEARVYADSQSILGPLLKGIAVQNNTDAQIALMVKTLLSRPNLEKVTRMTDMDIMAKTPKQYEDILQGLEKKIVIRKIGGRKQNLFRITYQNKDPELAKNVVQSLLTVFIDNTLGDNRVDADSAEKFLESQIKDYENRLLEAEARLTDFKQKYSNVLPSEKGGYYAQLRVQKNELEKAQLQLKEIETSIKSAKNKLQLNQRTAQQVSDKVNDANSVTTTYDERITQLEAKLDDMLLRYTDRHPDVQEAKRLLASLKQARKTELDNYYKNLAENTEGDSSNLNALNINPVYQDLRIQLNKLENEAASLRVRVKSYQNKVQDLENKIHTIPEIEAELVALNRGYDISKNKYEQLLSRKETAEIARKADESNNKIQFRVIDPPRAPVEPIGPKRILFFIAITIVGIGAGIGMSLLFSELNPVVTSTKQVTKATNIPVFGTVSANETLGLQRWHKRKTLLFILSNLVLLIILAGFMSYFLFPELVQAPLRRIF